jgi:predicted DNA-binding ribbon-helix-helix protein
LPPKILASAVKKMRNRFAHRTFGLGVAASSTVVARMLGVFMKSTITKRSVVIGGHKTSVSLEDPFWSAVREIAGTQEMSVSSLLRQIDLARRNSNLSSAIRVFVLENLRTQQSAMTHNGTTNRHDSALWRPDLGSA